MSKKPTMLQWIVIAVCLILMFFGQYFIPPFLGLTNQGVAVVCIFISTMILYCSVDIMWPTAAVIVAVVTNGLYTYAQAASISFGNWIVIYVMFSTLLTYALRNSGFIHRAAVVLISNKISQKGFAWFVAMFYLATLIVGYFIDPVTCFLVMSAILAAVFEVVGIKKGEAIGRDVMIGLLIIDSISSAATPIAHVNASLLTQMLNTDYGVEWSVLNFCIYGILASLVFLVIWLAYMFKIRKMDTSNLNQLDTSKLKESLQPMGSRERSVLIIYVVCVVLWFAPGILNFAWPAGAAFLNKLGLLSPALIGVVLLALLRDKNDGKALLDLGDGLKNGVAWGAVVLTAGCMMMGTLFNNADFGVVTAVTDALGPVFNGMNAWMVVFITCAFTIILTNFCSNTVMEVLVYGITVPFMMSGAIKGVNPMAFCATIGMACNFSWLTPMASGHSAVFPSCGYATPGEQFKGGIPGVVMGLIFVPFIAYPIACLFF